MEYLLNLPIFRNSAVDWSIAGTLSAAVLFILLGLRRWVRAAHQRMLATERTELLEVPFEAMGRTSAAFFALLALFLGLRTLSMSPSTAQVLTTVITVALFWQLGGWLSAAVGGWVDRRRRHALVSDRAAAGSVGIIGLVVRGIVWVLVLLLILDNLGVNITALVAGLGVGGVAVALAVQNILGDLFASLSITFDRPFLVGDFLIVDECLGSVENIGIKSTRLRSLSGEQIILSNADLLKSRVRNYGRMAERRIAFVVGVTYETPPDLLERLPGEIRRIIESHDGVRFDRSHFSAYGPHSLDFETVYYVLTADYNRYMDIQQSINLRLYRAFASLGAEFAYPTQKILVQRAGGTK